MLIKRLVFLIVTFLSVASSQAQLNIQLGGEYGFGNGSALTPLADRLDRDFLYVAAAEQGLHIFDVSQAQPVLVTTLDTTQLSARPMSLTQRDSLLYVCVGSHFGNSTDPPGITIVNVADPTNPQVLDTWTGNAGKGTGVVKVHGDYAYVGGMPEGLIILNISNPNAITFVSQLVPAIDFPHANNTQEKVNARGIDVVDSLVYLAYDAGGLRIINCANINQPVEIGMFANPITFQPMNMPRAYNHVKVVDTIAYITVDYCGLEVVSVADPSQPVLMAHYNPHDCPNGVWWDAPVHANEIVVQEECQLAFISTGKSEMLVVDLADPYAPVAVDSFGTVQDTSATWGIDVTNDRIFLTYLYLPTWVPLVLIPFHSEWGGVKVLSYSKCTSGMGEMVDGDIIVYPNPTERSVQIRGVSGQAKVRMYASDGKLLTNWEVYSGEVDLVNFSAGWYVLEVQEEGGVRHYPVYKK